MVTGLDLVEWQLRIAMGEKLPLGQDQIAANGHAIEARIYAEDPEKGFLPASGTIRAWREPVGEGIRIDAGFRAGDDITPYYDALLAKLIAWGADRPQALRRIGEALDGFEIAGVTTNLAFLKDRKSTRLNSSHANISYAVVCLEKTKPAPHPLLL